MKHRRKRPFHRGFTLIELLVVMAIIAILAGMIMAVFRGLVARQDVHEAIADIEMIRRSLDEYHSAWGVYPPSDIYPDEVNGPNRSLVECLSRDCSELSEGAAGYLPETDPRSGPFLKSYILQDSERIRPLGGAPLWLDPWGNPYIYFDRNNIRDYDPGEAPKYRIKRLAVEHPEGAPFEPRKNDEGIFYGTNSFQVWSCGPNGRSTLTGEPCNDVDDDITSWSTGS